ncbi:MAG: discoidin domain-containing protein [Alphaproteobacteria bacterium]|nr:discoidin domain-containing protein [Alphaproteobacteria bacterium]
MAAFEIARRAGALALGLVALAACGFKDETGGAKPDPLVAGFADPPDEARPCLWWQWMNGNITKEGIGLDLEWMRRVGFGCAQMFDVAIGVPPLVDKRIVYRSPEWYDAVKFAIEKADALGLEMTLIGSPGWSESGGTWVTPEQAMKKVVWSETRVSGPGPFGEKLARPPSVTGPYLDFPRPAFELPSTVGSGGTASASGDAPRTPVFYKDIRVLAYPAPVGDVPVLSLDPTVTSNAGELDARLLTDGLFAEQQYLGGASAGRPVWVQYEFPQPQTMRAVVVGVGDGGRFSFTSVPEGRVEASDDGETFRTLATLPGAYNLSPPSRTFAFPATTARFFRVTFTSIPTNPMSLFGAPPYTGYEIGELRFEPSPRVNRAEEQAAFGTTYDVQTMRTPQTPAETALSAERAVDLTDRLQADGTLDWMVPEGDWIVVRLGYSLTGAVNAPAQAEATGLEADKLSKAHVTSYLHGYLDPVLKALGPLSGERGLTSMETDSWEAGQQNWTDDMIAEFKARRGYDPTPYLPALAGRVVAGADETDRFLWDFRRTIADLIADNHYGVIRDFLAERGLKLYGEAIGVKEHTVADGLQAKSKTDVPLGEFWLVPIGGTPSPDHIADIREAASAAHVYGQNIVGAESFTVFPAVQDPYKISPRDLKWIGDKYLALGVNWFQISTGVHQPFLDRKPGITLGPFGLHFTRNHTWAEQSRVWVDYLARGSFMMRQGRADADIAYFYGEGAPAVAPYWKAVKPDIPQGYAYDYVGADAILNLMSVKDGRIVLPSGQSYAVLVLPEGLDLLSLPLVTKLGALVAEGATVIGSKPQGSPSLSWTHDAVRLAAEPIWGPADGKAAGEHAFGKGRIFWGESVGTVLSKLAVPPALELPRAAAPGDLVWASRLIDGGQIFFVANQTLAAKSVDVSLRGSTNMPRLFDPMTGTVGPATYRISNGRTIVSLDLDPQGSVFVVLRGNLIGASSAQPKRVATKLANVAGPWEVRFPEGGGAPPLVRLGALQSWTEHADPGVRYFSGSATYATSFDLPADAIGKGRLLLDLGEVRDIAEVSLNGTPLGTYWKTPYRVDLSEAAVAGTNALEVRVTNNWANRMIGDVQPGAERTYTFTTGTPYKPSTPLQPSGLLGPVAIVQETVSGQ